MWKKTWGREKASGDSGYIGGYYNNPSIDDMT